MTNASPSFTDAAPLLAAFNLERIPAELKGVRHFAARTGEHGPWPQALPQPVRRALQKVLRIEQPWLHQSNALELILAGTDTIVATGTASGKSLCYQGPILAAAHEAGTALYLAPTKALAADQLTVFNQLAAEFPELRPASYDGDTDQQVRAHIRQHANVVLTNPDMLHHGMLPNHPGWSRFFKRLRYVVIDEAHSYRGVFGTHTALVLRRLRRICAHYNAQPTFIGASATSADPASMFSELTGVDASAVVKDHSAKGPVTVGLWEPPVTDRRGDGGVPLRRSILVESADLLTNLVANQIRSLDFARSRRGVEAIAANTQRNLEEFRPDLAQRVRAYRGGYLKDERRDLEQQLKSGDLLAVASTSALELGVDISSMDAVLISGWPGTRASFMQQLGRAGRAGQGAVALFIAGDDPLDAYLVNTPEAIFDAPVEDSVFDPFNKHLLAPHLCAAAAEVPLTTENLSEFVSLAPNRMPEVLGLVEQLEQQGLLRRRPAGWFWVDPRPPASFISLRSAGDGQYQIIDVDDGTVLGTMESGQTHAQAHPGAVYVHQGQNFLVHDLDLESRMVFVQRKATDYYTQARSTTSISILGTSEKLRLGSAEVFLGPVRVTQQVVSFQRKALLTGENLGEEDLLLPPHHLETVGFWFTIPDKDLAALRIDPASVPGSLHAAEHAMIGLLPLIASCDRWDIGGVSIALHPDTNQPTVFVYDGHTGGAGFVERGFHRLERWLRATRDRINSCVCESGCPSCVQSPKCGNRNHPLDKNGALLIVAWLLALAEQRDVTGSRDGSQPPELNGHRSTPIP
ncbi:DEAD/DEAH box helicase [Micrococcoides hystricis]|uniref:DEAD/DEAH box helicase n=1 Tax=Micrococcoides hystricis TaxID=1572761 RepID=A0ABV6PD57_9MICC